MNFLRNPNRTFTLLASSSCHLPFVGSITPEIFGDENSRQIQHEVHANLPAVSFTDCLYVAWNQGWVIGISALNIALYCWRSFVY